MPTFTYVVTQRVDYFDGVDFDAPEQVIAWIEGGADWDHKHNEVVSGRVQVYDAAGNLVADTAPDDCTECGRNENAGFVSGEPRCHRYLENDEPFPQGPEDARVCIHGNRVWFGNECGLCDAAGKYIWREN